MNGKRKKILLALLGLRLALPLQGAGETKDLSMITLNLNDNASLLVADEQGHLTGVDPTVPKLYQEIPESNCNGLPAARSISLFHPQGARYQVAVIGTQLGTFR